MSIAVALTGLLALILGLVAWVGAEAERAMQVSEGQDDWDPNPGVEP